MNRSRRFGFPRATAVAFSALFLCAAAQAQVLEQLPDDTLLVVKIKDLQGTSAKVAALAQQFGVTQARPEFNDPIGALEALTNLKQGVDKSGDAAFVLLNSDWKEKQEPLALILVPIGNYQQFIANFENPKKDGDFDVVKMKDSTTDTFVSDWGKYAALGPAKEALKKGTGLKVAGAAAKELETKDLTVYANFKVLGPKLLPELKANRDKLLEQITTAMAHAPNANPKLAPVMKALFGQYLAGGEAFLQDAQSAVFSLNLSNDGIATTLLADFTPGSYCGSLVQGAKNTDASLTAGLPDNKYIIFGGARIDGPQFSKLFDDIAAPIVAEVAKLGDDGKGLNDYIQSAHAFMGNMNAQTFGLIAPTGGLGQSALVQAVYVVGGDARKLLDADKQMMQSSDQITALFSGGALKFTSAAVPNAKTIEGVPFDQFQMKIDAGAANTPEAMQMQQMMTLMYGPAGATTLVGVADDQHLVVGLDTEDDVLAALVKSVKANEDTLGKLAQVEAVNKNLPASRVAAFYFSVDTLAATVSDYARKMGMAIPLNLKPNLAPIATAVSTDGSAVRVDTYISADLVSNVVAAGMQLMMKMGGGPGGL